MKKILAIDGGGAHGIIPASTLVFIEKKLGRQCYEFFDMFAGTSTGGIIAAALTKPDPMTAEEILNLYLNDINKVFKYQGKVTLQSIFTRKYNNKGLTQLTKKYLGIAPFRWALKPTLIPAYDIKNREPYWFKSWRNETISVYKVALATSAAPTYFCSQGNWIDGGVFANNPATDAVVEARRLWPDEHKFLVVSLGTGEETRPIDPNCGGLFYWANKIIGVLMEGQADKVDSQLTVDPEVDYYRFQTRLDNAYDEMDDTRPEQLKLLQLEADELLKEHFDKLNEVIVELEKGS